MREEMDYMIKRVDDKCGMEELRDVEKDLSFRIDNNFNQSAKLEQTNKSLEELNEKFENLSQLLNLTIAK